VQVRPLSGCSAFHWASIRPKLFGIWVTVSGRVCVWRLARPAPDLRTVGLHALVAAPYAGTRGITLRCKSPPAPGRNPLAPLARFRRRSLHSRILCA